MRNWLDDQTLSAVVNGSISTWRPVTSGIPQILGLALLNIFVSDTDSVTEGIISKFANDSKLCGLVNTLEGKDAIQRDLDRLARWECEKLFKFKKAKCKVLHVQYLIFCSMNKNLDYCNSKPQVTINSDSHKKQTYSCY
ncbi:hypothetical protein DUI87_08926 [Hirundo rustica rustica]|uniref:Reverse transcriptase domain-containing protein n=1 Tax=Hirundo rustica rustica TaxID=333673 RepID=A0A3M0KL69_HIRRU|nr:hypothetical protein DUI87_08926 [Hirundo rustica rustica]